MQITADGSNESTSAASDVLAIRYAALCVYMIIEQNSVGLKVRDSLCNQCCALDAADALTRNILHSLLLHYSFVVDNIRFSFILNLNKLGQIRNRIIFYSSWLIAL